MNPPQEFSIPLQLATESLGLPVGSAQVGAMWQHFQLLRDANQRVNLTRILDPAEAAVKHYADSLAVLAWASQSMRTFTSVLDVGTGGGFPAIPLAICNAKWKILAIDGTQKKVRILQDMLEHLQLEHCHAMHQRVEQRWPVAPSFDLIVLRAVGMLNVCLERVARMCAPQTVIACYKGDSLAEQEQTQASRVCTHQRLKPLSFWKYQLPLGDQVIRHQLCLFQRER